VTVLYQYYYYVIIIIIIIITFMQGIYTYIPETNYVPREYSVAAILLLLYYYCYTIWMSLVTGLSFLALHLSQR